MDWNDLNEEEKKRMKKFLQTIRNLIAEKISGRYLLETDKEYNDRMDAEFERDFSHKSPDYFLNHPNEEEKKEDL